MKQGFLLAMLITCMAIQAQELSYRKFLSEGKCWYQHAVYHYGKASEYIDIEKDIYYSYLLIGDTLIDDKECKKMYLCSEDTTYHCAMYEVDRKVMYIPKGEQEAKVLYDFQENPQTLWEFGMEWPKLLLMTTDTVSVGDNHFRRMLFSNEEFYEEFPEDIVSNWVEGVGCAGDIFKDVLYTIKLAIISNEWEYTFTDLDSCYENGKRIFTCEDFFKEPITSSISKSSAKGKGDKVVYDLQGRPVVTPQKNGLYIKNKKKFIYR